MVVVVSGDDCCDVVIVDGCIFRWLVVGGGRVRVEKEGVKCGRFERVKRRE